MTQKKSTASTFAKQLLLVLGINLFTFVTTANAANTSGATGGLTNVNSALLAWQPIFYTIVGTLSVIYLTFVIVAVKAERKQWTDFWSAVGYVALAGGVPTIAVWAYSLFV